jgi:hypothetical protein
MIIPRDRGLQELSKLTVLPRWNSLADDPRSQKNSSSDCGPMHVGTPEEAIGTVSFDSLRRLIRSIRFSRTDDLQVAH